MPRASSGRIHGDVGIYPEYDLGADPAVGRAEQTWSLGYVLGEEMRGKSVAKDMAAAMIEFGDVWYGVGKIVAVSPETPKMLTRSDPSSS
jgi:RimJ/RimL family protein N-acetyltransferase